MAAQSQSAQLASVLEQLAGGMAAITERLNALEQGSTEQAQPAKQDKPAKATSTASNAAKLVRKLDPVDVDTEHDGLTFRVIAANGGGILTNGSRVVPITTDANGRERIARSLTADMLDALTDDVRGAIKSAMEQVDKRAHIGAHKPTVQAS